MKIQMLVRARVDLGRVSTVYNAGKSYDLADREAMDLIAAGKAVNAEGRPAPAPSRPGSAEADPGRVSAGLDAALAQHAPPADADGDLDIPEHPDPPPGPGAEEALNVDPTPEQIDERIAAMIAEAEDEKKSEA